MHAHAQFKLSTKSTALKSEKGNTNNTSNRSAVGNHSPTSRAVSTSLAGAALPSGRRGRISRAAVGGIRVGAVGAAARSAGRRASGQTATVAVGLATLHGRDFEPTDAATVGGVDGQVDAGLGDLDNGAARRVGDAGGDHVGDAGGHGGDVEVVAVSVVADQAGAALGGLQVGGGGVVVLDQGDVQLAVLLGERVIVATEVHAAVAVVVHDAVVIVLLRPLEYQAAGHDGHFLAVQHGDFVEGARLHFVAAVLGEEDGDGAVAEHLDQLVIAGGLEGGFRAAPGVGVQAEEVGARHVLAVVVGVVALQVCPAVLQDGADCDRLAGSFEERRERG